MRLNLIFLLLCSQLLSLAQAPTLVKDFFPGDSDAFGRVEDHSIVFEGSLIFPIISEDLGEEVGILRDGELTILKDIMVGEGSSSPRSFVEMNGKVYFFASNEESGSALWYTDGTEEGTKMFVDPDPSQGGFFREMIVAKNGKLYYNYINDLFVTDGIELNLKIHSNVFFANGKNQGLATYTQYKDGIAFIEEGESVVELFAVSDSEVELLAATPNVSDFPNFYGLCAIDSNLLFILDDSFSDQSDGTYFYDAEEGTLTNFGIGFTSDPARRLLSQDLDFALAIANGGYYAVNGNPAEEHLLFSSASTSLVQGQGLQAAAYEGQLFFATTQGTFFDDFLVHSDGTEEGTKTLFEVSQYTSNMLQVGRYAYFASGTSNLFSPKLYELDIQEGTTALVHNFGESSTNTNSVLLMGVIESTLYFLSNLDPEVGRELYSIELDNNPTSAKEFSQQSPYEIEIHASTLTVKSPYLESVKISVFGIDGSLQVTYDATTNSPIDLARITDFAVLDIAVGRYRVSRKYQGSRN